MKTVGCRVRGVSWFTVSTLSLAAAIAGCLGDRPTLNSGVDGAMNQGADASAHDAAIDVSVVSPGADALADASAHDAAADVPVVSPSADGGVDGLAHDAAADVPVVCSPSCGAHHRCVADTSGPTCACVAGYQPDGSACLWGTVPQDPGFQNIPANAWALEQGAVLNPAAGGNIEAGEVEFSKATLCTSRGRARQTITMPSFADSGLFALKVASNGDCTGGGACLGSPIAVVLNGGVNLFPYNALSTIQLGCLGERSYGGTFDVVVRPSNRLACPSATTLDAVVDHVSIEPSTTCPTPGTIPDPSFDAATSNWTGSTNAIATPPAVAEVLAGAGTGGSRAGHISIANYCQQARLGGPISPPLSSIPNLALQVSYTGTAGEQMRVEVGGVPLAMLPASGAQQIGKVCLLESNKGMTQTAAFGWSAPPFVGIGCGAHPVDLVFDDLRLVTDPSCPAAAWIPDGTFERTDPAIMWESAISNNGVAAGVASVGLDSTPGNVHGGANALKLVNNIACGYADVAFPIAVPPSNGAAGPALTFFYKAPVVTSSIVSVIAGSASLASLPAAASYTQSQLCLDPTTAGQTTTVLVKMDGGGSLGCSSVYPTETLWLDDVSVGTSASCPTD